MKDRNLVLVSGIALSAFLLALPALAQPSPPWCSADPLTSAPLPAPKWSQLDPQAIPDYRNVSQIFHVNQSLRLLISGLEKALQQLKDGKSLAGATDIDGICLCNCGRDVSSWIDFIGTTVKTETVEALQKTEDRYLRDLDAQLGKTLNTIDTTVPAFRQDLEKILRDTCTSNPSLCTPQVPNTDPDILYQHASGAANDKVEMIFKTELATIRPLVVGPNNLRQRLENLRAEVRGLLTALPGADSASIAGEQAKVQQVLDDAKSILDDVRAGSQALAAAYQAADLASWTSQIGQAVKDRLAQDFQGSTGSNLGEKVLAQIKQAAQVRVQAIKTSAQDLYNTALQHRSSIDQFSATFTDGVLHDLKQVAGCYGTTKRSKCTDAIGGFCQGTPAGGQLFGQEDLTLPLWYPTEVFKDGKTALRYALATVDWLAKVRELIEKGPSPKLLAGGQKLIDVLKNGQKLLDELNQYVDTYTDGFNLGAYSDIRRDLHFCVGYGGSGALAELFEFSVGDKHVRGGASYLSTNLSEKHRFQLRSGGFDLNVNGRSLPLAPGLSLNSQIDGFRLWDRYHPFGIQGFPTISTKDVGQYDIFNLASEKELENNVCGDGKPCNLLVNALYQPYFPIMYTLPSSGAHKWPRSGVDFDRDAPLTSVFGAGLNLDLEMKTYTWNIAPIMVFPGATVTPWLSLDAGIDWHYGANRLRDTLVTSINKNLPAGTQFDLKGFNRDGQALQGDDVTEDVEAGAHVNPKLGADLTVGLDLASWLKVGITADLYVGVDVAASGAGGVLDLNRALVETLAVSNPPGDDCKPVIEDNVTSVCSNTFFQQPDRCAGKKDCVDRSRPFPGNQLYSTGTYVCKGEGTACESRGYCMARGTILAHDVTREQCAPARVGSLAVRVAPNTEGFFPYQCLSTSRPQVTGYKGADCNPIEYGYPSACGAGGGSCACEPGPSAGCATGRSCVEGGCLLSCATTADCASGQACQANRCVLANGIPFAEQIVWRMKNAG
ncbi:MAG: hypothetical protein QOJ16_1381, partial [Acidobacteriota bacterium]|nr:hypothetical protein [Acidobacteriota bacterium]